MQSLVGTVGGSGSIVVAYATLVTADCNIHFSVTSQTKREIFG